MISGIAQSVRSKDEQIKKHLTSTYMQIIELLLTVSTKKTDVTSELRQDLTVKNVNQILEKFTSVDQLCRSLMTQSLTTTSKSTLTDIAHTLQETLDQIRLSSSALSLKNE